MPKTCVQKMWTDERGEKSVTDLALSAIYRAALLGGLVFTVIQPSPLPRLEREIVGRDTTPRFNVRRWRSHGMQFNVVPRTRVRSVV